MGSLIIATVDAGRSNVVIWWTNVASEPTASMRRNCGAWTLAKSEVETIDFLTAGKISLATPTGRKFLDASLGEGREFLNPNATLAAVLAEQHRLQTIFDGSRDGKGSTAKPLLWPAQPSILQTTTMSESSAPKPVQRALGIANWLVLLSEYWESIEQVRLSRPVLRMVEPSPVRDLPIVSESPYSLSM